MFVIMNENLSQIQSLSFELKKLLPKEKGKELDNLLFGKMSERKPIKEKGREKGVVNHPKYGRLLTPQKASQITGYSQVWLLKLAKMGRIRYIRPQRRVLYYEQDIMSYIN